MLARAASAAQNRWKRRGLCTGMDGMPILQEQKIGYVPGCTADNGCCVIGKVRLRQKLRFFTVFADVFGQSE